MKKILPVFVIFILAAAKCLAQDGTLDNSFGVNGIARFAVPGMIDAGNASALQPDGKIVNCATFITAGSKQFVVVRFNANGTPDNTFGTAGKVTTDVSPYDDVAYCMALQQDGKIVVGGYSNNASSYNALLVRYNTDGSLDNSFNGNGKVIINTVTNIFIYGLAIQPDGKIVAVGASEPAGQYEPTILRYNTNGTPDNTFNGTGIVVFAGTSNSEYAIGVALQPDGKIVTSGYEPLGINAHGELIRLNTDGSPDNTFGINGLVNITPLSYSVFEGVIILASGKIAVAALGTSIPGSTGILVLRFNTNGTLDNSFNGSGYNYTHPGYSGYLVDLKEESNGKLIATGSASFTDYDFIMTRYKTDGSFDSTFDGDGLLVTAIGTGSDDMGYSTIIQPNGQVIMTGNVQNGADYDFGVMRVNTDISTLPILLLSFEANKNSGQSVLLSWATSSEQNNKGFEIQRSADGINFKAIGWVNGIGNASTVQHYFFTDVAALKGKNFYRLKQIDLDAKSTLSDIRKINFDAAIDFTVYSNPVQNEALLQLSEKAAIVKLTDVGGRKLWQKEKVNAGMISIPMQELSSGIYLVQVTNSNGDVVIQKIVKR